ncbi:hypothetical protein AMP9_3720 [plant metagenome]|uniref:Uncharacterized protein n=1 Tax=plant metagenome TaxID=1297885 RepID=A0A484NRE8_9ZZZZ
MAQRQVGAPLRKAGGLIVAQQGLTAGVQPVRPPEPRG